MDNVWTAGHHTKSNISNSPESLVASKAKWQLQKDQGNTKYHPSIPVLYRQNLANPKIMSIIPNPKLLFHFHHVSSNIYSPTPEASSDTPWEARDVCPLDFAPPDFFCRTLLDARLAAGRFAARFLGPLGLWLWLWLWLC